MLTILVSKGEGGGRREGEGERGRGREGKMGDEGKEGLYYY